MAKEKSDKREEERRGEEGGGGEGEDDKPKTGANKNVLMYSRRIKEKKRNPSNCFSCIAFSSWSSHGRGEI